MFQHAPLFHFRHGDHACVFYRSEDALLEILTPYIAQGLLRNERCFLAQKPEILKRLVYDLRFLGMDPEKEISRGVLQLHTPDEVYGPKQNFKSATLIEALTQFIRESNRLGFSAFRSAGELGWAASGQRICDQLIEYEALVDKHYPHEQAIGICQYPVNEFTPGMLKRVLEHHRLHLPEARKDSKYSSLYVRYSVMSAEIVADRFLNDPRFYYVVRRTLQGEVIGWGVAPTFNAAIANAERIMGERGGSSAPTYTA